jgi:hypothetical protein
MELEKALYLLRLRSILPLIWKLLQFSIWQLLRFSIWQLLRFSISVVLDVHDLAAMPLA